MRKHYKAKNEIDLGERKVSVMNFSRVVTLPKPFTDNYLNKNMSVRMTMSAEGKLILTPVGVVKSE